LLDAASDAVDVPEYDERRLLERGLDEVGEVAAALAELTPSPAAVVLSDA